MTSDTSDYSGTGQTVFAVYVVGLCSERATILTAHQQTTAVRDGMDRGLRDAR